MIYVVSYDFRRPIMGTSNIPFTQELERSRSWSHFIENTWFISTPESIAELTDRLGSHVGRTDKVIITKLSEEHSGWLPDDAWNWIRDRINAGDLYQ